MNLKSAAAILIFAVIASGGYFIFSKNSKSAAEPKESASEIADNAEKPQITAVMKTNLGSITFELFPQDAPKTVENFVKLSKSGFYDGVKFHRVIKGFMVQSGDPNSKDDDWSDDGTGGPGYTFEDEINSRKLVRGSLAMANYGPDTNGSQFFILTAKAAPWLDGKHTVFGKVAGGMDTVFKIENVKTDKARGDHPISDIVIENIKITEN